MTGAGWRAGGCERQIEKARTPVVPLSVVPAALSRLSWLHSVAWSCPCWLLSNRQFSGQLTFGCILRCDFAGQDLRLAAWHRLGDIHQVMTIVAWDAAS